MIQEGLATVVVACGAYFFIYNYPDTAGFLSSTERSAIQARLAADSDSTHDERFTWDNVLRAFKDPKCWLYGLGFHTTSLPLYTYSLFLVSFQDVAFFRRLLPTDRLSSQVSSNPWATQLPMPSCSPFRHTPSPSSRHWPLPPSPSA